MNVQTHNITHTHTHAADTHTHRERENCGCKQVRLPQRVPSHRCLLYSTGAYQVLFYLLYIAKGETCWGVRFQAIIGLGPWLRHTGAMCSHKGLAWDRISSFLYFSGSTEDYQTANHSATYRPTYLPAGHWKLLSGTSRSTQPSMDLLLHWGEHYQGSERYQN